MYKSEAKIAVVTGNRSQQMKFRQNWRVWMGTYISKATS